jgi:hypothetical protein
VTVLTELSSCSCRYAGLLVYYASALPSVQNLLWAQMIGRAFAAIVHNSMRSLPAPRPREDYYGLAINYLNLLLGIARN